MNRSLNSLSFCSVHKTKLKKAGYEFCCDLTGISNDHLSKEISVSLTEAAEILRIVNEAISGENGNEGNGTGTSLGGISAFDLLMKEESAKKIITFSQRIDEILEGGVPVCKITEICGSPGIGKTQLCLQLAVDATIPCLFGGPDGEAVYIDTEGSFVVERISQIAKAAVTHIQCVSRSSNDSDMIDKSSQYTMGYILGRIHYYRCHTYLQLIALTNILHTFISEHPSVCLVIIDSIASPFRHGFKQLSLRNRLLCGISQTLIQLAIDQELAIVLTNQMTTRVNASSTTNTSCLVPALGDSWGHSATIRLLLYWEENQRCAFLFKTPSCKEVTVRFQITGDGVRDVAANVLSCDPAQFPVIATQTIKEDINGSVYENGDEMDSFFEDASAYLDFNDDNDTNKRPRLDNC